MDRYEFLTLSKIVAQLKILDTKEPEEKERLAAIVAEIDKDLIPLQEQQEAEWKEFYERSIK
jgi:hypothetical protein